MSPVEERQALRSAIAGAGFRGISQDSQERVTQFQAAHTGTERRMAFDDLHALLSDAILIAPMAASAANDLRLAQAGAPAETASAR